jgi:sporulation integral membrane protein YtvI
LEDGITRLFSDSSAVLDRVSGTAIGAASSMLGSLPDGLLLFGTAILSSFMISAQLSNIRNMLFQRLPETFQTHWVPALRKMAQALRGWLKAQFRLAVTTFAIVTTGLILLRFPYAVLWGSIIALVDAVPLLGTGTIMLPWSLICLLQGDRLEALGLVLIYAAAALTRSLLEPRLVGRQLGLNPLLTLLSLYAGYRIWGVIGMVISPILAVTAMQLSSICPSDSTFSFEENNAFPSKK